MARQAGQPSTELERWLFKILKMVTDSRLMEEKTSGEYCRTSVLSFLLAEQLVTRSLGTDLILRPKP